MFLFVGITIKNFEFINMVPLSLKVSTLLTRGLIEILGGQNLSVPHDEQVWAVKIKNIAIGKHKFVSASEES